MPFGEGASEFGADGFDVRTDDDDAGFLSRVRVTGCQQQEKESREFHATRR